MKQAIIILAHGNYPQLKQLIEYFEGRCDIFIHIDKKGQLSDAEKMKLSMLPGVKDVKSKYVVHWGGFSILKAEMYMLNVALKNSAFDYIHLLSGQDLPIRPLNDFLAFFSNTTMDGFCSCVPMTDMETGLSAYDKLQYYVFTDYINGKSKKGNELIWKIVGWQRKLGMKRRIPDCFSSIYQGSAWFSFRRNVIEDIVLYTKKHKSFYNRLKFTYVPEETYITTVALNSDYHITRNNNCRIISWKYPGLDASPKNMTINDFPMLITSRKAFFARKFNLPESAEIVNAVNKYMLTTGNKPTDSAQYWSNRYLWRYDYDTGLSDKLIYLCLKLGINSICDFGCGPGWYVSRFREKGLSAIGYDINPHTQELSKLMCRGVDEKCCATADLSDSVDAGCRFDIVLCLSVGEYLPVEKESDFIGNLTRHTGKYLVLSWSETQADNHIVNPRTKDYLLRKIFMTDKALIYNEVASIMLREASSLSIHKKNIMVFQRKTLEF